MLKKLNKHIYAWSIITLRMLLKSDSNVEKLSNYFSLMFKFRFVTVEL